jgi:hypothetical protein
MRVLRCASGRTNVATCADTCERWNIMEKSRQRCVSATVRVSVKSHIAEKHFHWCASKHVTRASLSRVSLAHLYRKQTRQCRAKRRSTLCMCVPTTATGMGMCVGLGWVCLKSYSRVVVQRHLHVDALFRLCPTLSRCDALRHHKNVQLLWRVPARTVTSNHTKPTCIADEQ